MNLGVSLATSSTSISLCISIVSIHGGSRREKAHGLVDGTPRPRFKLWLMFTNGNCHRRLFPFADHDGVHFLREGVIVLTLRVSHFTVFATRNCVVHLPSLYQFEVPSLVPRRVTQHGNPFDVQEALMWGGNSTVRSAGLGQPPLMDLSGLRPRLRKQPASRQVN